MFTRSISSSPPEMKIHIKYVLSFYRSKINLDLSKVFWTRPGSIYILLFIFEISDKQMQFAGLKNTPKQKKTDTLINQSQEIRPQGLDLGRSTSIRGCTSAQIKTLRPYFLTLIYQSYQSISFCFCFGVFFSSANCICLSEISKITD